MLEFFQYWSDKRLKWDMKDYGNIFQTELAAEDVWKPDLLVYNSADPTNIAHFGNVPVTVYSSGTVVWMPPATVKTECPMDLTYWPFDTQTCEIYMGSWTRHGFQISYETSNPNMTTEQHLRAMLQTNHHWEVKNIKLEKQVYDAASLPYYVVRTAITMQRNSPAFTATVILPGIAVAVLTLIQFVLPVDYPPRVTVGLAATLACILMLIELATTLPPLGASSPLIGILRYYGFALMVSVLSIILSGLLARLSKEPPEVLSIPVPGFIKGLITGPLATVLGLRFMADKDDFRPQVGRSGMSEKDNEEEIIGERKSFLHEWLLLATIVDRLSALTYLVVFICALLALTSKLH
ncbi:hypothetical protein HAZT_HAZT005446 [Hyalella azteca]|uniref:Neurotransmitter-gated ion-channel ligand-binding domain-containing protein n=1 Tax=Hyalella azteca TaxID=294128 RepID=A0A6A0H8I7_HYAAZ|nr:hypothetical protein HAZT_HAZT005446 [Hyalella azteca]